MMSSSAFTVTRTNQKQVTASFSDSNKQRVLVDRTDIDMSVQRTAARLVSLDNLQGALTADYNATISSRDTHCQFLRMMLNEVQQYHHRTFNVALPKRAIEILSEEITDEMHKEMEIGQYAKCLRLLAHQCLYSATFQRTAALLVANEEKEKEEEEESNIGSSSTSLVVVTQLN